MDESKRLKIIVLSDFFFPDSMGGANKMAFYTAGGLVSRGHHVSLITRRASPELPDQETIEGIDVYRYDLPHKTFLSFNRSARPQIRHILHSLEEGGFQSLDLMVLHQPIAAMEAVTHPFVRKAPWIYNFHSPWGEEYLISRSYQWPGMWNPALFFQKKIKDWIEGKVLRRCQRIILLSRFMQQRLERVHGLSQKSLIIPGGVDTGPFSPPGDRDAIRKELGLPVDRIILFTVRNLRKRMGLMNLIRAMADLGEIGEKVFLVMAGKGELEDKLKRFAEQEGLGDRIRFPGRVTEEALLRYYQSADLFLLPTEYLEGFGMVTLEALATGVPVVATPVGATPEIISKIGHEWLCQDTSVGALASRIKERVTWLAQFPDQYEKIKKECRELAVRIYAWPRIMDQWEKECREVIRIWQERV
ncbi:MAG: glycosyltransferase family 4 protein [bacterium]